MVVENSQAVLIVRKFISNLKKRSETHFADMDVDLDEAISKGHHLLTWVKDQKEGIDIPYLMEKLITIQ
jgi:hypothetical protein